MKNLILICLLTICLCEDPYPANFEGNFDSSEAYPDHSSVRDEMN